MRWLQSSSWAAHNKVSRAFAPCGARCIPGPAVNVLQDCHLGCMPSGKGHVYADMPEEVALKAEEASKETLQDLTTALCKNTEVSVTG